MIFGILTLITALAISAVAIYYSVAGLVAIFAAAAVPIMIMGGTLEIAKLVTAVWLHKYWDRATWWLKSYLSIAVVVLMFITSMGIFGFLSKAHIEQTSASEESIARVESITSEIDRQNAIVTRANTRIGQLENSETGADATIQGQIDKEQGRIDLAFERIQPAIAQQNQTITDARASDTNRTKPYEDQLTSIQAEVLRLEQSAREYESKISTLEADTSAVQPLLDSIDDLEAEIIRVTNQLQSSEKDQIRAGQAIIGVSSDGAFGGNTRRALVAWVEAQRARITQVQLDVSQLRQDSTAQVDAERTRLAAVVSDIRTTQIPALKDRELTMLAKIDEVRQTESPVIQTARDEIQRLRASAESQVAQSQTLIERLRSQLGDVDNATELEADIDTQQDRIKLANIEIDTLTEEKIGLEAEYRKLEAEVGPIKYIAEFVYGESADSNMLEEAVRWVIIIIIFVFDPLAVLLLIAAQYTFEFRKKELEDDDGDRLRLEREEYERARAQRIVDNPRFTLDDPVPTGVEEPTDSVPVEEEKEQVDETLDRFDVEQPNRAEEGNTGTGDNTNGNGDNTNGNGDNTNGDSSGGDRESVKKTDGEYAVGADDVGRSEPNRVGPVPGDLGDIPDTKNRMFYPEELEEPKKKVVSELPEELNPNSRYYADREQDDAWVTDRAIWESNNPDQDRDAWKNAFEKGEIDSLPWETTIEPDNYSVQEGYQQNAEQSDNTLFNKLSNK
jgi:FtsZ-binding cell division protein ZapB